MNREEITEKIYHMIDVYAPCDKCTIEEHPRYYHYIEEYMDSQIMDYNRLGGFVDTYRVHNNLEKALWMGIVISGFSEIEELKTLDDKKLYSFQLEDYCKLVMKKYYPNVHVSDSIEYLDANYIHTVLDMLSIGDCARIEDHEQELRTATKCLFDFGISLIDSKKDFQID